MAFTEVGVRLLADISGFTGKFAQAGKAVNDFANNSLDAFEKNKKSIDDFSNQAGVAGAAFTAAFGYAMKVSGDFNKALSAVKATGANAKANIDDLADSALELGPKFGFSGTEAAQGIEELLKAGVETSDVLNGGLAGALSLAAAGELEVGDAAEIAATAMTQFKLGGEDVGHIADLLAAGAGKAQGGVGDLAYALKQSGLVASQFGLSLEETVGTLTAFASAGLLGSDAGTSFRNLLLRLANPTKESADLMEELNLQAYDAQGQFVGMANFAEQLKVRMADLTDAQKSQYLATLFGSDAIRAANVLMEQGAEGIANWTKEVDDAGYAAQVAADRQDNLAGDLAKLKASIDRNLISGSSGATEALRGITQGATDLVTKIGQLPAGFLQAAVGFTAFTGGALLTVSAVGKVAGAVSDMRGYLTTAKEAMDKLNTAHPKLAKGLKNVAQGFALLASVAAVAGAFTAYNKSVEDATNNTAKIAIEIGKLNKAGADASSLDDIFKFESGTVIKDNINGIEDAMKRVAEYMSGPGLDQAFDSIGLTNSATAQAIAQFQRLDSTLTSMATGGSLDQAQASFKKVADRAFEMKLPAAELVRMFPQLAASATQLASSYGYTAETQEELVDIMAGNYPPAMRAQMSATKEGQAALAKLDSTADSTTMSITDLTEALNEQAGISLSASQAAIAYERSLDAAQAALKENGKTLDITTEKGRANREALDDIAQSSLKMVDSMAKNGAGNTDLVKKMAASRESFIKTAMQMGATRKQAEALADEYKLIPGEVDTVLKQTGAIQNKKDAEALTKALNSIPPEKRAQVKSAFDKGGVSEAYKELEKIDGKVAKTYINTYQTTYELGKKVGGKYLTLGYAGGGQVRGPGGPTDDRVPILASNGEVVIRAASVDRLGLDKLLYANQYGVWPKYANGGEVQSRNWTPAPTYFGSTRTVSERTVTAPITVSQTNPMAAAFAISRVIERSW